MSWLKGSGRLRVIEMSHEFQALPPLTLPFNDFSSRLEFLMNDDMICMRNNWCSSLGRIFIREQLTCSGLLFVYCSYCVEIDGSYVHIHAVIVRMSERYCLVVYRSPYVLIVREECSWGLRYPVFSRYPVEYYGHFWDHRGVGGLLWVFVDVLYYIVQCLLLLLQARADIATSEDGGSVFDSENWLPLPKWCGPTGPTGDRGDWEVVPAGSNGSWQGVPLSGQDAGWHKRRVLRRLFSHGNNSGK